MLKKLGIYLSLMYIGLVVMPVFIKPSEAETVVVMAEENNSGKYDFQLIDINRMSFYPKLTERQRLANLRHFNCKPAVLMYILERYAVAMNIDCEMVQMRCVSMRFIDTIRHKFKQQLKSRFRR